MATTPDGAAKDFPHHILCGLDLEAHAADALVAAAWLSTRLKAPLEVVHAFPQRPLLWGKESEMPEWIEGTEAVSRTLRQKMQAILAAAPAELALQVDAARLPLHVSSGPRAKVILQRAVESKAGLIVLGRHEKRSGLDFGNTLRGVVAHAPRGVWIQPGPMRPVRRILAPVDMSEDSLKSLAAARDLALQLGARLSVLLAFHMLSLHAAHPDGGTAASMAMVDQLASIERNQFQAAMDAFDWRGVPHETHFEEGEPSRILLARQADHDLIVLGTHGHTGLSAAILGSVANAVVHSAKIPVLAMRYPRRTFLI